MGWTMTIMAGLRIVKGRMIDVQTKIAADPRVFAVYDVTGEWDSMVLARVKDREDLDNLTKTVFTLDGVSRSFTHVVLNTVKEDGMPKPPSKS
jgi:DNA-binding Lrp family transcriptional regulator